MPVRLNTIPGPKMYPVSPGYIKWASMLVLLLTVGVAITSLFASGELVKNSQYFWCMACGIPVLIWLLLVAIRWLVFITYQIQADAWNQRREEVILQETCRGRRALQVLHVSLLVAIERDEEEDLLDAFLNREQMLNARFVPKSNNWVRHSMVPVLIGENVSCRLSRILLQQFIEIKQQLELLSENLHIKVLLDIHTPLSEAEVKAIWQDEWQKNGLPKAHPFSTSEPGLANVDDWLDNHIHEKAVLLVSSVYLEPENLATTAESAFVLLLANRLTQDELIPRALLHRPERITTIEAIATGVEQALDWVPLYPEAISGTWGAELNTKQRAVLLSLNQPFCQERTLYELDTFLGRSGPVAPWLSTAIAALAAIYSQHPQLTFSGVPNKDHLWATVVSPYVIPLENK